MRGVCVSPTWRNGLQLESVEKRKERKRRKDKKIIILYYGREISTVPEKSPKIPVGRKRHPEE